MSRLALALAAALAFVALPTTPALAHAGYCGHGTHAHSTSSRQVYVTSFPTARGHLHVYSRQARTARSLWLWKQTGYTSRVCPAHRR